MSGRKPDYILKAILKSEESKERQMKGKVGAAWDNGDGSFSIRLDPFVVLQESTDLFLTLFPNDRREDDASR